MPRRFLILSLVLGSLCVRAESLAIGFGDLPQLLEASSPQLELYSAGVELAEGERRAGQQWSNPELAYSREYVESGGFDETEELLYLGKSFEMPWSYFHKKHSLALGVEAAELQYQQNVQQITAKARSLYVRLKLLEDLAQQQGELKVVLSELRKTITARRDEGALAPLEANLLSTGLFALETELVATQYEYERAMAGFKQMLGVNPADDVMLTATIDFAHVNVEAMDATNAIQAHAGLQAQQKRVVALDKRVAMEKGRILPSVTLLGGYKHINQDWKGYTAGLSLPLPILNWNRGQVEQAQTERRMQETQSQIYERELRSELKRLARLIETGGAVLGNYQQQTATIDMVENLSVAYREGALPLTEFLSAVQLQRDGTKRYTQQLIAYYEAIFELEALSGQQFVTF